MNYEEKLRLAEYLYNKVRFMSSPEAKETALTLEKLFPELRESDDEKWRKWLIGHLKGYINQTNNKYAEVCKEAINWLEKQGEQNEENFWEKCNHCEYFDGYDICLHKKNFGSVTDESKENCKNNKFFIEKQDEKSPIDESEPKFKIGDWIINNDKRIAVPEQILKVEKYGYLTSRGYISFDKVKTVEPKFKVGDWISFDKFHPALIVNIIDNTYEVEFNDGVKKFHPIDLIEKYYHLWTIQDAKDGDVLAFKNNIGGIIICKSPTDYDTRSYCRLVSDSFIGKEESGWDSTLLYPSTKEQRDFLFKKMQEAGYEWDSDKKELKKIEQKTAEKKVKLTEFERAIAVYIMPQLAKYTEEQIIQIKSVAKTIMELAMKEYQEQKFAWSEEDEKMLKLSLENLTELKNNFGEKYGKVGDCIDWLKSIKPHWKPSEEQIKSLRIALQTMPYSKDKENVLVILEQLTKL